MGEGWPTGDVSG